MARAERSDSTGARLDAMGRARIIAALKDPHLVPMGPSADGSGFEPELAGGRSLAELQGGAGGPLSLPFGLKILLDALRGLAAVHSAKWNGASLGFVHGELTPTRIVLGTDGRARLIPLVPAHLTGGAPSPDVVGYTAPERLLGDSFDQRADVFSAGVLLWEAIMGEPLFRERTPDAIVTRLIGRKVPYPVPSSDAPWAVPLSDVALRALSVEPRERWAHIGALGSQIEKVARGRLASPADLASLVVASANGRARDSNADSLKTVRGSYNPDAPQGYLHSPQSGRPPVPGATTLAGIRAADPVPASESKPAPAAAPRASSVPADPFPATTRMERAPAVPAAGASAGAADQPAGQSSPPSGKIASASPGEVGTAPTLPGTGSAAPASSLARGAAPSGLITMAGERGATSVVPGRSSSPPSALPMSARKQWTIAGSALLLAFAVAGIAAYLLLDWSDVSTASKTVLVPTAIEPAPAPLAMPVRSPEPKEARPSPPAHAPAPMAAAPPAAAPRPTFLVPGAAAAPVPAPNQQRAPAPPPRAAPPPPAARPRPSPDPARAAPGQPPPPPRPTSTPTERFGI